MAGIFFCIQISTQDPHHQSEDLAHHSFILQAKLKNTSMRGMFHKLIKSTQYLGIGNGIHCNFVD
jgi:hypothetical protein